MNIHPVALWEEEFADEIATWDVPDAFKEYVEAALGLTRPGTETPESDARIFAEAAYELVVWREATPAERLLATVCLRVSSDLLVERAATPAIEAIAARLEPDLRRIFLDAVSAAREATDVERIAALLLAGNIDGAAAAAGIQQLEASLGELTAPIQAGFLAGGQYGADELRALGLSISFDLDNPRAAAWAGAYSGQLITSITDETRSAVRTVIAEALTDGLHPYDTAKRIKELVGLTTRQQESVATYARRLHEQGLGAEVAEGKIGRYADAQLRYRARMIARTETLSSANHGQDELWQQAYDQNLIGQDARREWLARPTHSVAGKPTGNQDSPCPEICEPMDGEQVGLHEDFRLPDGRRVKVPPAHPHCVCAVGLKL